MVAAGEGTDALMTTTTSTRSDTTEVHRSEREKWDALAQLKLSSLTPAPIGANFHTYARESAVMPGVAEFLGDLSGLKVLEYGCGLGELTVLLARSGASVTSFDISETSVAVTQRRAEINGVAERIDLAVAAGEDLPYADQSFDVIVGKGILHHLDPAAGAGQLARVLKPGGKAAFSEPMGMNPALSWARDHVPYPGKNPPGADKPVNYDEIAAWGARFADMQVHEIQLLSMLERGFGFRTRLPALRRADDKLLARFPSLRRYCRFVVLLMTK